MSAGTEEGDGGHEPEAKATAQADALQHAIFHSANFSSIATDAKGVIQIFNVGAERMLGYSAAEAVDRMTPADLSDPADLRARATALSAEMDTAIAPGFEALVYKASRWREDIYELTYVRKDGSRFPAVVSVTALRDDQDNILGYLLIGTDNTARKRAEEKAIASAALQNAIFDSADFSSIATDAAGVIQVFNVGAEQMFGYAARDAIGKMTLADLSDREELTARATALSLEFDRPIAAGFEALVFKASQGMEDIGEMTCVRRDRTRFPAAVSVTALREAPDKTIGYLLIGTDNSARKPAEEERTRLDQRVRDQQFYTRSLIESSIDALMATDRRGIITDVNKQTEVLTGGTRDELIGSPFKNHFTDPARAEAGIQRVLREGRITNYELSARAKGHSVTQVSCNATTFRDRNRGLQGVFAAVRDVTELRLVEQALEQKNLQLESASQMKSEFLANMSHELRTPLTAIIGFSEVLQDRLIGELTEQQRGFVGDILSSGRHLLSLINDILDLSKVEAGKMALQLEPVDVSLLFASALSVVRDKARLRSIRLTIDADEDLGALQVDGSKVEQIIHNLVSNAVKFTPDGGEVSVRARRVSRADVGVLSGPWIGHSSSPPRGDFERFLEVAVTDSGIGIAPEDLTRLFTPFCQIDGGPTRRSEGTGLGLAMVKLLVELHGGVVAVQSGLDEGSCFTLWLPLRTPDEGARASMRAPPTVPASPQAAIRPAVPTALVVEDDPKTAELISLQLQAEGFRVLHAGSAEAAMAIALAQHLSLITLDIALPGMDGWEFLRRVRLLPALACIPVVIISITANETRGAALGAAAVMQKPVSRQELYESLVNLGLLPVASGRTLKILVVDDDPRHIELIAVRLLGLADVLRANGGEQAIVAAQRDLPDLLLLDLMMPEVNGFDVVKALNQRPETARIPIVVLTAKEVTEQDRARLRGDVVAIMNKMTLDGDGFRTEVRRAVSGRRLIA